MFDLADGALDALGFDEVIGFAHTGGIDEAERDVVEVDDFLDRIAGGSGDVGDDGAVESEETVKQRGFSDIRLSENDRADTFAENAALIGGGEEGVDGGKDGFDPCAELEGGLRIDVLVGKIDPCLEVGENVQQFVTGRGGAFSKSTLELGMGGADRESGLGGNEIHDSLGLGEIEFPVQESALGEFTWRGVGCATFEEAIEHFTGDEDAAMAGELDRVLAGERVRREKRCEDAVIDQSARSIADFAST